MTPKNLFTYSYAILRELVARALVSNGLLPSVGIFHHNKYNCFCLAHDLMELYRTYVGALVYDIVESGCNLEEPNRNIKSNLLMIPTAMLVLMVKNAR